VLETLRDADDEALTRTGSASPAPALIVMRGAPPDEVGEMRLFHAFRAGQESAFEGLYRRHAGLIHGLALRLSTRRAEAEDLVQEVFLAAWEHRATFETPEHLVRWLRRVTVNRWINRVRRRREVELDADDLRGEDGAGHANEPVAPPMRTSIARLDLERALATLSPRLRAVFLLFDVYGMSHEEISTALNITAGASKVQLHRARQRLREQLQ
jgi:RNA polymerase sigma factor (sigma-70 family)